MSLEVLLRQQEMCTAEASATCGKQENTTLKLSDMFVREEAL
jgi:hypothetical protein